MVTNETKNKNPLPHAQRCANNTVNVNERSDLPIKISNKKKQQQQLSNEKKRLQSSMATCIMNEIKQANKICQNDCMDSIAKRKESCSKE